MSGRSIPPLAAIRVFEAAARHLSFTRAGEELGMSQAAVSYQIKLIEERVGVPLFLRRPRGLVLTDAGERLRPILTEAFDLIAAGFGQIMADDNTLLQISVVPTFSAAWLAPRIGFFQMQHPTIGVRMVATRQVVDFLRDEVDVAIRAGRGPWPGLVQHRLFPTGFTPILAPSLLERLGPLEGPADLLDAPLLDPHDQWWPLWFAAAGVSGFDPANRPFSDMGDQHVVARAAIAGHGIAILTPVFHEEALRDGRLVQPFELVADDQHYYWLCYAESRRNVAKIRAFRDWLLAEMAAKPSPMTGFGARPEAPDGGATSA
ncbi:LysR substrate-binding domain-containing protein [Aurantimonas sp. HBX-1]|uniref:LysR substrate-binding domain-containing protein n=1 Tax=Aurantimonas sp. HBX-1 TaxID=2906072 RepID=UPI001F3E9989|nr:LysR substrate-binding domain-containing protein [Aurantimonas sp. HBX-1]UIJ71424.1 LysR substrate-binding domain-containing protein [Aurantimonas sp. HBX-1]